MKNIWIALLMAGLFSACRNSDNPSEMEQFRGLWSLYAMEQQDAETGEWKEWRGGMQGYILYDGEGGMAVHLTTRGYEKFDLLFPNFNDSIPSEALRHLTNSYVYFARYTVDEEKDVVEHARISHSNPAEWNNVVRRKYMFSGDTLILEPVEPALSSLRLKWIKSK
jgi:hypothetical protein